MAKKPKSLSSDETWAAIKKTSKKHATENNTDSKGNLLDHADTRPDDSAKRTKNQDIENWLRASYNFRYNNIKQKPEWKEKKDLIYTPIDKYKLLSIKRELDAAGFPVSKDGLLDILCSSFAESINPVKDYFNNLAWDGHTDYISDLLGTVKCVNSKKWNEYFKRWLVGVVANVFIDEKCMNHLMLVLTGTQGKFKTTWLENLCPKILKPYMFTGKINLESKDTLTLIAENLFVNIDDQLKQLHKRDENELKNLITINKVTYRRPYDPIITEYPHLCSFMASVNGNEFLSDPTGSRRFLPFEVEDININAAQKIDMDGVWAQVVALFRGGKFRYWFDSEEIDELNRHNEEFSMISTEEQLISYYFAKQATSGTYGNLKFMPTAIIQQELERKSGMHKLSSKKIGEALIKLGYKKDRKMMGDKYSPGYFLYEKTSDEIEQQGALETEKNKQLAF